MLNRLALSSLRYFSSVKAYNSAKNYYKVLNLTESASQKDIKRSFRELAKKYHPDSTKGK
jgi:DnaJ-domain-containing protein 1